MKKRNVDGLILPVKPRNPSIHYGYGYVYGGAGGGAPPPPPSTAPELRILGNGIEIANGSSSTSLTNHTLFVNAVEGAGGTTRTFTVQNTGDALLTTSSLTVPTGFTVTEGLSASISAGSSDTFTIRLNDSTLGVKSGNVTFSNNDADENPASFAISGEVVATDGFALYDFGLFSSGTRTMWNDTGATRSNAPVTMFWPFHAGALPTTRTLQLRGPDGNLVASDAWQFDTRVTNADGSMKSCIVRCYGPADWTVGTSKTWTLEAIDGSWPAESGSQATSLITSNTDFQIDLEDIIRTGANDTTTQAQWTHANLRWTLNNAIAAANRYRERTKGPIYKQWIVKYPLYTFDGATADTDLWCEASVEVWTVPTTGAFRYAYVEPILANGYARNGYDGKIFKIKTTNSGVTLRNFSTTLNRTAADFDPTYDYFTNKTNCDWSSFEFRCGSVVKLSGSVPNGLQSGKCYALTRAGTGGESHAAEWYRYPPLMLEALGKFRPEGEVGIKPGTGGGTFTMTGYSLMIDKDVFPILNRDGEGWWLGAGACEITPNMSDAELKYLMQCGAIPNVVLEKVNSYFGSFEGMASAAPRNTSLIPLNFHNMHYQPGAVVCHRSDFSAGGTYGEGGSHLNDISVWSRDVILGMGVPKATAPWVRRHRIAAAENAASHRINTYDPTPDANGFPVAEPICFDRGPAENDVPDPGMGPCFPAAEPGWGVSSTNPYWQANGASNTENLRQHFIAGSASGSHISKEQTVAHVLFGRWIYLRISQLQYTQVRAYQNYGVTAYSASTPLAGSTKRHNGVTRYCVDIVGWDPGALSQPRSKVGCVTLLKACAYTPRTDQCGPYFHRLIEGNVQFLQDIYTDNAVFGSLARKTGIAAIQSLAGGGQQAWQLARHAAVGLWLVKASGLNAPNAVKFLCAWGRFMWNDPIGGGSGFKHWNSTYIGHAAMAHFWDNVKRPAGGGLDMTDTDPRCTMTRFLDDATTDPTGEKVVLGEPSHQTWFNSNNTITIEYRGDPGGTASYARYENGDRYMLIDNGPSIPGGMTPLRWYWLYDRVDSGNSSTYKLSPVPGPSYTQATWTGTSVFGQGSQQGYYERVIVGTDYGHGQLRHTYYNGWQRVSGEYFNKCTAPMTVAATCFGSAAGGVTAIANFNQYRARVLASEGKDANDMAYEGSYDHLVPYPPD